MSEVVHIIGRKRKKVRRDKRARERERNAFEEAQTSSFLNQGTPQCNVIQINPNVGGFQQNMDDIQPNVGGFQPNMGDFQPNVGGFQPNVGDFQPNGGGFQPNVGGFQPNVGDFQPNMGGFQSSPVFQPDPNDFQLNPSGFQSHPGGSQPNMSGFHPNMGIQGPHPRPQTIVDQFDNRAPNFPIDNSIRAQLAPFIRPSLLANPSPQWKPVDQQVESEADKLNASSLEERWKQFQVNLQKKLASRAKDTKTNETTIPQSKYIKNQQQERNTNSSNTGKTSQQTKSSENSEIQPAKATQPEKMDDQNESWPEDNVDGEAWDSISSDEGNKMENKEKSKKNSDDKTQKPFKIEGKPSEMKLKDQKMRDRSPVKSANEPSRASTDRERSPGTPPLPGATISQKPWGHANPYRSWNPTGYPKGVPRSFLKQQYGAIQPQSNDTSKWSASPPGPLPFEELHVDTDQPAGDQQYSPSEMYSESRPEDGAETDDGSQGRRLSAFQRLGPQSQPKKPKLTINLVCNSEQSVREVREREVVDETPPVEEDQFIPVHQRKDINESTDETVMKYLTFWPWKRHYAPRRTATIRTSKSVMILELEQMEEIYDKDTAFILVTARGYPPTWRKENVLDAILDELKGKSFIPCFTEFTPEECKFAVIRSRNALTAIHRMGFLIRKDDVELTLAISYIDLSLNKVDFIPRLVLRKRLAQRYDGERKLDLSYFTLKSDISHFIYFPLNRLTNQSELLALQSTVVWAYLTDLDLSRNRLTSIDGFDLPNATPKLKNLDLSHNCLEKITVLLRSRPLALKSIKLEGNPLCRDYIDDKEYVKVVRMLYPELVEIDGVQFQRKGEFPTFQRNFSIMEADEIAEKFLEVFFNLLDSSHEDRRGIEELYHEDAVLTITHRRKLRYRPVYRQFRSLFQRARNFQEGEDEKVEGPVAITKIINKWPMMQHDPYTFTVDVMYHTDTSTIIRINGMLKPLVESLAEEEFILAFTRTVVLVTSNGYEYRILNELLYWEEPTREYAHSGFQINALRTKTPSLKLESPPDEEFKEKLVDIFVKLVGAQKSHAARCLEQREWNLKTAIEYYVKLVKLDDFEPLYSNEEK